MITLLLDRMGYRELKKHDPLSDEVVTISGIEPRALTTVNIAVRLLPTGKPATREQVIAMRGSLHHFEASEGAIICLSGFDKEATSEAAVPNLSPVTLIDAQTLTEHMVRCGVGVRNFNVAVACLDEPVFRDVVGD
jgi:restriction endonuclease Mrr